MPRVEFLSQNGFEVTEEVLSRNPLFTFSESVTLQQGFTSASREQIEQFNLTEEFQNRSLENVDTTENQQIFRPTLTQRLEFDEKGKQSQTTTVCGDTVNRREGSNLPELTLEGIITEDKVAQMKALKRRSNPIFISDLYKGEVYIKRVTIEQTSDLLYWVEDGEKKLAFNFQLQTGKPEE